MKNAGHNQDAIETAKRILRALNVDDAIETSYDDEPDVFTFTERETGREIVAVGFRSNVYGKGYHTERPVEDDDYPDYTGRDLVVERATAALKGTGWKFVETLDHEKGHADVRITRIDS